MMKQDCRDLEAILAPLRRTLADALALRDRRGVSEALAGQITVVATQVEFAYANLRRALLMLNTRTVAEGSQLDSSLERINEVHASLRRCIGDLRAAMEIIDRGHS